MLVEYGVLQPAPLDVLKLGTEQEAFETRDLVPARRDDDGRQVPEPDIHRWEEQTSPTNRTRGSCRTVLTSDSTASSAWGRSPR